MQDDICKMNICSFRDDNSEYQDHMDTSKCISSIKISSLSLMDPLRRASYIRLQQISTQRGHWAGPFLFPFFFQNLFRPNCKISPFNIFLCGLFQGNDVTTIQFRNSALLVKPRVVHLQYLKGVLVPLQIL